MPSTADPTDATTDARSSNLWLGPVLGITIGVLALVLLGALLIMRRRRKPRSNRIAVIEKTPCGLDAIPELDGAFYVTQNIRDAPPHVAELDASERPLQSTSTDLVTRTEIPRPSRSLAARGAKSTTQAELASTEIPSFAVSHARFENAAELPSLVAAKKVKSGVAHPQELADAASKTPSVAPARHETRVVELDGEDDVKQQIKRIREEKKKLTRINRKEKERLRRINELERLETALQDRLAGRKPTPTTNASAVEGLSWYVD